MDHCSCPSGSCYCGTLAEYFRECTRLGGKIDEGWRSNELCRKFSIKLVKQFYNSACVEWLGGGGGRMPTANSATNN